MIFFSSCIVVFTCGEGMEVFSMSFRCGGTYLVLNHGLIDLTMIKGKFSLDLGFCVPKGD